MTINDSNKNNHSHNRKSLLHNALGSATAGIVSRTCTHPLDTVRDDKFHMIRVVIVIVVFVVVVDAVGVVCKYLYLCIVRADYLAKVFSIRLSCQL